MVVLITEDGERVITVSRDVLSTSEGLGNVPREVTGGGRRAWAPLEPEHRLASVWFKVSIVSRNVCYRESVPVCFLDHRDRSSAELAVGKGGLCQDKGVPQRVDEHPPWARRVGLACAALPDFVTPGTVACGSPLPSDFPARMPA